MNEEINSNIIAGNGGLAPMQNVAQQASSQSGLGVLAQQVPYQRNSSLAMFELANAEKNKAKEMFYENEAMKAKTMQQDLGAEKQAMQQSQVDNSILSALKSGSIDEATANAIFQDRRISDTVKKEVADVFYPVQATKEAGYRSMSYANDEYAPEDQTYYTTDEDKQAQIYAQSRAAGIAGDRNVNWQ